MKKGISLIVLVITIIVMIIIAGAIIISLNSSNVIGQANDAVEKSDLANARSIFALTYAEILGDHYVAQPTVTYTAVENSADHDKLKTAVEAANKPGSGQVFSVVVENGEFFLTKDGEKVSTAQ